MTNATVAKSTPPSAPPPAPPALPAAATPVPRRPMRPLAPSRLACVFACPSENDATLYAVENNPDGHLRAYEVEPTDASAATHVAAISHCTMTSGVSFVDLMEPRAHLYWEGAPGDPTKGQEILFSCPLRVVRPL